MAGRISTEVAGSHDRQVRPVRVAVDHQLAMQRRRPPASQSRRRGPHLRGGGGEQFDHLPREACGVFGNPISDENQERLGAYERERQVFFGAVGGSVEHDAQRAPRTGMSGFLTCQLSPPPQCADEMIAPRDRVSTATTRGRARSQRGAMSRGRCPRCKVIIGSMSIRTPDSLDAKLRDALLAGHSLTKVARLTGVSRRTVIRWCARHRADLLVLAIEQSPAFRVLCSSISASVTMKSRVGGLSHG